MADKGLGFYDAVLAVTQEALNHHFQDLFAPEAFKQQMSITIDADHGISVTGTMGTPTLTFLPEQQRLVKMTVPFGPGSTFHGGKVYNNKLQKLESIENDLTGKSLGFVVALERMSNTDVHDADFTVQALYVQLTELKNIDTDNFGVKLEDLGGVEKLFTGVADYIKRATKQAQVGQVPESLFAGRVQIPTTPDTQGAMRPHEAAFSATVCAPSTDKSNATGELNFLLMMKDRPLPTDARAGLFNGYWGSPGQPKAPEITLALSDFPLLENFAQPAIMKAWPKITLNLNRGGVDVRSRLVQQADCTIDNKTTLTGLVAQINDSGQIQIDMSVLSNDRLQVSQAAGKPDIDFSLLSIQLTKPIRYYLTLTQDDTGNISCTMVEDQDLKNAEPTESIRWNGDVSKREDIVKWITGLALLLIPGVGEIAEAVMIGCQAIATTIEVQVNDRGLLNSFSSQLTDAATSLNTSLELPGSPVMTFGNLRMNGAVALIDGTFVAVPPVTPSQIQQPYALPPYPREKAGVPQNVVQTDPLVVGETILSFKYVTDPDYLGSRRSKVPYYLLRREQYWKRINYQRYSGTMSVKDEVTFQVVKETKTSQTIENATEIKVGVKGEMKFVEMFSPELSAEISHTLKTTTVTEVTTTETETVTHTTERPVSEKGYTIATWIAVDHYIVRRPVDGKIIAETEIYNEDYLQEDRIDDPANSSSS